MSCVGLADASPRISARTGRTVDLNIDFLRNGILTDPYAVRFVEIYKAQVLPHNLVTTIPVVSLDDTSYPAPLCQDADSSTTSGLAVGKYHLLFDVPTDFESPEVYFDLWYYFADDPCGAGTTNCDIDEEIYDDLLLKCCHRFWVYPDGWFCDDRLQTVRFGFEPLDQKFFKPESRPLEIGIMPLPLYDFNFNLVTPMIPFLRPVISIETQYRELLVDSDTCSIGIRSGSFRTNPWVVKYDLDTSLFLIGTYRYWLTLTLPDGTTRVSRKFIFTVS